MSSSLKDNLSSDYIDAFALLLPKAKPSPVLVYVESDEDIAFWKIILHRFENERISFQVNLPSSQTLAKGKTVALQRNSELLEIIEKGNIGKRLIVCVDSDYDYLLPTYRPEARLINESPYIFQTYSYAMENLKCYAESLQLVCTSVTLIDQQVINLVAFVKHYSEIIYKLFIWNLYFYNRGDFSSFTIEHFCEVIKILEEPKISELGKSALENVKNRVSAKIDELNRNFADHIDEVNIFEQNLLSSLKLNPSDTYLFVKGHIIMDNVVLMLLKPLCESLKRAKRAEIKQLAQNAKEVENNINAYKNNCGDVISILSNNTEFKNCFLYQKLHQDLVTYIKELNN